MFASLRANFRKIRIHGETPRSANWFLVPAISFMGAVPMWGQVFSVHVWWGTWGIGFAVDYLGAGWYSQDFE